LHELQDAAQEALEEMRRLIFELRPPILEQAGLAAALQARLDAVEGRSKLETELIVEGAGELPAPVEQALYRIAQEALNNTLKHARARRVSVTLRHMGARVVLELSDDGAGFDPAAASQAGRLGLRGIAERVAQLDGRVQIDSAPGKGTRLRVELPL
jgi:signal transduction histidine kinase